ncbi:hypothetical protein DABAL43B_1954 [Psychrobacter sp. DAB_AL43B]|nr:hypothetical protein DABAL43B_1954 [Psychrobacter sp. DAB_AL43B]
MLFFFIASFFSMMPIFTLPLGYPNRSVVFIAVRLTIFFIDSIFSKNTDTILRYILVCFIRLTLLEYHVEIKGSKNNIRVMEVAI